MARNDYRGTGETRGDRRRRKRNNYRYAMSLALRHRRKMDKEHVGRYADGYAAGKEKAHFELRAGDWRSHANTCGCEPCITAKAVLHQVGRRPYRVGRR